MALDYEKYKHHMDAFDLTEEQKRECFGALEAILQMAVDLELGNDSVSLAIKEKEGRL